MKPIENHDHVAHAIRHALFGVGFQIVAIVGFVLVGAVVDLSQRFEAYGDPWNIFDALLLAVLGLGMYAHSRTAAVVLVVYFVLSRIQVLSAGGVEAFSGLAVSLAILFLYVRGAHACFVHHRLRREEDPAYRPRILPVAAGAALVFAMLGCAVIGGAVEEMLAPSGFVRSDGLDASQLDALRGAGILAADESFVGGDFANLDRVSEHGTIVTERRVVHFETDLAGDLSVQSRDRARIASIEGEDLPIGGVVRVRTTDEPMLEAWLSDGASAAPIVALSSPVPGY